MELIQFTIPDHSIFSLCIVEGGVFGWRWHFPGTWNRVNSRQMDVRSLGVCVDQRHYRAVRRCLLPFIVVPVITANTER